jgi:predicted 3-demethylubiquinone-9 3-methyltransferase (glyoxalase superfamily)
MPISNRLTPCLWFDGQAEEAATLYVSIFKNSKITSLTRYGSSGPGPKGSVMTVGFELDGLPFLGLNGGPMFKFSEAVSMIVNCEDQKEIDHYWDRLCADGGKPSRCGWLKDKFGFSWQIVPASLSAMMTDKDAARSQRVFAALMEMTKIDLARLRQAYDGA